MPAPRTTLVASTLRGAALAAMQRGNTLCQITLSTDTKFNFQLADVIDDALIGARPETPNIAALIPYHAIVMIEFVG